MFSSLIKWYSINAQSTTNSSNYVAYYKVLIDHILRENYNYEARHHIGHTEVIVINQEGEKIRIYLCRV